MGCKESKIILETEEINSVDESVIMPTRYSVIHQTNEHKALICRYNQLSPDSTDITYSPKMQLDIEVAPISIQQLISPQNTIKQILIDMKPQQTITDKQETKGLPQARKQKLKKKKRIDMKDLERLF